MKRMFVLILVVALMAVTVMPALAAGGNGGGNGGGKGGGTGGSGGNGGSGDNGGGTAGREYGGNHTGGNGLRIQAGSMPFALAGKITSIDPTKQIVTVSVSCGNTVVKPFIGQSVALLTSPSTRFLLSSQVSVATPITFADLVVGQSVSASGQLANNIWTATRITAGAALTCLP